MSSIFRIRRLSVIAAATCLAAYGSFAFAQEKKTDDDKPADPDTGESTVEEKTLGILPQPYQRYGVKFAATYIGEVLGNTSGGVKRGTVYEGRLNLAVDADLDKLLGLHQLTFHANLFQIQGEGLSRTNVQNLLTVSGIEALPTTRLYEAYFEKLWGEKTVSLKIGQLAADSEFFNAKYTEVFTNASFGWPAITSVDLPSGGPSPPLAAVGARVLWNVNQHFSALLGLFDGDQAGPGLGDPQERNRYGLNFRVTDPPLLLGQLQYAWNNEKGNPRLAGQVKVGGWRHFGSFADQRLASNGVSLASPSSSGTPSMLSGDYGVWATFEQQIFRIPGSDDRGIGIFTRASFAPSNPNLVDAYADAGVQFNGMSEERPDDKIGLAAGYAHISKRAQQLDLDYRQYLAPDWPQRSFEGLLTAVYQYQLRDGWTVQPNVQYVVHPGGGATNPTGPVPGRTLKNATVFGMRTTVKF